MNLQDRIYLLAQLGKYILSDDPQWQRAKKRASQENSWFIPEFIELAASDIAGSFLQKEILESWSDNYKLAIINDKPQTIGIVMAGNIPLVGFHDWLCVFISGHKSLIKLSSKDHVLFEHLIDKMIEWNEEVKELVQFADMLKGCDAYIATGSNNSSRYFEYYFGKYPHIIRRNRTSVAILTAKETNEDLEKLADDVYQYFGLGCRNATKIYLPFNYNFVPLLTVFKKYNYLADHHKYKNNYDYNLAIQILNKKYYMTNDSILLIEELSLFSPISQLNYEFYNNKKDMIALLQTMRDVQCIIGKDFIPFGQAQKPGITDYADGADTLMFLTNL
ncbi:MAG TPA: acyl-CoA reductase [Chitinophagaceae bacterium]|nr:acyl-CoA reductase [Chitinophagaceae bacterium]